MCGLDFNVLFGFIQTFHNICFDSEITFWIYPLFKSTFLIVQENSQHILLLNSMTTLLKQYNLGADSWIIEAFTIKCSQGKVSGVAMVFSIAEIFRYLNTQCWFIWHTKAVTSFSTWGPQGLYISPSLRADGHLGFSGESYMGKIRFLRLSVETSFTCKWRNHLTQHG